MCLERENALELIVKTETTKFSNLSYFEYLCLLLCTKIHNFIIGNPN